MIGWAAATRVAVKAVAPAAPPSATHNQYRLAPDSSIQPAAEAVRGRP
jgi:hypothetical protein